jgi:hypothetical protein
MGLGIAVHAQAADERDRVPDTSATAPAGPTQRIPRLKRSTSLTWINVAVRATANAADASDMASPAERFFARGRCDWQLRPGFNSSLRFLFIDLHRVRSVPTVAAEPHPTIPYRANRNREVGSELPGAGICFSRLGDCNGRTLPSALMRSRIRRRARHRGCKPVGLGAGVGARRPPVRKRHVDRGPVPKGKLLRDVGPSGRVERACPFQA